MSQLVLGVNVVFIICLMCYSRGNTITCGLLLPLILLADSLCLPTQSWTQVISSHISMELNVPLYRICNNVEWFPCSLQTYNIILIMVRLQSELCTFTEDWTLMAYPGHVQSHASVKVLFNNFKGIFLLELQGHAL